MSSIGFADFEARARKRGRDLLGGPAQRERRRHITPRHIPALPKNPRPHR